LNLALAAMALLLFVFPAALASDAKWTNNAASTWATGTNWDTGIAPGATSGTTSTDTATFYATTLTAARTVTVDAGRNIQNILFTNSTPGFALTLSGGSLLLSAGGKIELTSDALANVQTFIASPISLQGSYTILNNGGNAAPTANPLELQAAAAISGAAGLGNLTFTLGGTNGNFGGKGIVIGVISNGTGNTLNLVKEGAGNWQLNGANTFTGGVTIKQGGMIIGGATGLGPVSVPVTFGDSATGQDVLITTGSGINIAHAISVVSGAGNRRLTHVGGSGNGTYSGVITLNNKDVMLRNFSGNGTRTLNFTGAFGGTGNVIITNGGVGVGNVVNISGSVTNIGAITNVSTLGDANISGAIGANVSAVVQDTATSFLNLNSAANAYTGRTIVNQGTLSLGASASIASSTNIHVASGATFNVSAVTGGFTLANGQTLQGEGTVNGNLATAPGAKVSPADSGVAGTLFFNNNLNTSAGGSLNFDVSTSSGSGNDALFVSGTLTAGGTISLSALSGAANLDTTADYVLANAASISGSFASTPTWVGTAPANAANFSIVTTASQVLLHFNASVPPTVTASANPASAVRGATAKITATVTPGSLAPGSAITSVTVDLSSIDGLPTASLVLSNNNVYTNTFTVGTGSALGATSLGVTATDASALQGSFGVPFTVLVGLETWNGAGANDDWGTVANWTNNASPLTDDLVFFAGATRTSPNLETSYSVAGVTFLSGAASFNIGTANSSTLTATGGITNDSANAQTISAPLAGSATTALLVNAAAGDIAVSGAISDSGFGLVKLGGNTLTLSAANSYFGPTVVSNGTVTISGSGTLGGGAADLTVTGAASAVNLGGSSQTVNAATIAGGSIGSGTVTATSYALQGGAVSANLAGSGATAAKTTTNTLVLTGNNTFDGTFTIFNTSAGLSVNSATALGLGTVDISQGGNGGSFDCTAGGAISNANNNALSLSGDFTFLGSQSLNLGAGNANMGTFFPKTITVLSNTLEIAGNIFSGGTMTFSKAGAGQLILSGASTYFGATAVNGGTLLLTGAIGSTNAVTVNSGGILAGTGSMGGALVVNTGGIVSPGASLGTLTVASNVTVNGTLAVEVNRAGSLSDKIVASGTAAYGGTLAVTNVGAALQLGDSFTLVTATGHSGSFTNIIGSPGTGLAYSFANGVLSVVTGVATNPTNITSSVSGNALSLSWPGDHLGWTLQTNAVSVATPSAWFAYPGSASVTNVNLTIDPSQTNVFFRLVYP
jgi:fibronectin-binding autotransporter adhesin